MMMMMMCRFMNMIMVMVDAGCCFWFDDGWWIVEFGKFLWILDFDTW